MWVVILEMVLALALAVFIVWFTWPKKREADSQLPPSGTGHSDKDGSGGAGVK